MRLCEPDMIPIIDRYAIESLGIPESELIRRSGDAVADAVRRTAPGAEKIAIFAGCGNNGADGYAAAINLAREASVTVFCVFPYKKKESVLPLMQRAEESGVKILPLPENLEETLRSFDVAVDAIFGTGFSGKCPERVINIAEALNSSPIKVVAVDVPIGTDALGGKCETYALRADTTVELSYPKVGLLSYPAREYVGELVVSDIGLDTERIHNSFDFSSFYVDSELAAELLPKREKNSHKGNFGRVLLICGSREYRGAAHLAAEAALRGGAGYVTFAGDGELCREIRLKFPEIIFTEADRTESDKLACLSSNAVTLVGCGCGADEELAGLVEKLILTEGAPLVLDADAINSLAIYSSADVLNKKRRKIILTPHPLELARLMGVSVSEINASRLSVAREFAAKYGVTLILKGAASITADGERVYINSSGSSALAKAGSGDVLAGLVASLTAQAQGSPTETCALAAYLHGRAADLLSAELSEYGVTPSDLPRKIAQIIAKEINNGKN